MTRLQPLALLVLVLLALPSWLRAQQPRTLSCIVSRVIDGDTIACRDGLRVRLLLIDTPEMNQGSFGRAARTFAASQVPLGTTVTLELDVRAQDRYGRTLAYVHLPKGGTLNEALLRAGYAVVSVYPPNVRYVDRYRAIADSARRARRGLWSVNAFDCSPQDHRRGRC